MSIRAYLAAAALLVALPDPALGGVQVIGHSYARLCYEAADKVAPEGAPQRPIFARDSIRLCDRAFAENMVSGDDAVATYVNRGILKMKSGDTAGAIADYDTAMKLNPNQPEAWLNKGVALARGDAWAEAIQLFTMALEKRTSKPALAHFGRAWAHESLGDIPAAYRDYREASRLDPEWALASRELSRFSVRPRTE